MNCIDRMIVGTISDPTAAATTALSRIVQTCSWEVIIGKMDASLPLKDSMFLSEATQ